MQLKDFLRPPLDNGRGMHYGLNVAQSYLNADMPLLEAMGVKWCVFYVGDELQAQRCAATAWKYRIMPIIRPAAKIDGGVLDWGRITRAVLAVAPAAYIQIFNEPGDRREWKSGLGLVQRVLADTRRGLSVGQSWKQIQIKAAMSSWLQGYNRSLLVERWRAAASEVAANGGYPGLQSMDEDEIRDILVGADAGVLERLFFASHAYGSNHPPNYPYDARNQQDHPGATIFDDDTCALRWLEEREWVRRAIGFYPPLIVTEGGWFYQQSEDNRYPRTDDALHAQYHVAVFDQFRTGKTVIGQDLPDDIFGFCPWLWSDRDWDSWYEGVLGTRQQTLDAVKAMPAFIRKFSWDGPPEPTPEPEPEPEPIPEPEPPMTTKSKLGIHVPNANFRKMDLFYSIKWQAFTVLHLNRDQIPMLRQKYPHSLILVRAYCENWYQTDPGQWAQYIASWWADVSPYTKHLTFANEQNLSNEGHPDAAGPSRTYPPESVYHDINNWNLAVIRELRRIIPEAILHFPALSQGHSDDQNDAGYVGFEICRLAVEACDYIDVHTYWNGTPNRNDIYYGKRYQKVHTLFPNKPMFISEFGSDVDTRQDDGADYVAWLNELPEYIEGATLFIWDSDAPNAPWAIYNKPNIIHAFQTYEPIAPAPTPEPAPVELEQAVLAAANARKPWMAINDRAALYKFAQANKLGYPQTDEYAFTHDGAVYIGEVFNLGIVYVKKGEWGNVKWVKKPAGM